MRFVTRAATGLMIFVLGAVLLVAGLKPYWGCITGIGSYECVLDKKAKKRRGGDAEREYAVRMGTISLRSVAPTIDAFGQIVSGRTLELRAPLAGRLVRTGKAFRDGGVATEGDLLFAIDPADPEARRADAAALLVEAEAEASEAKGAVSLAQAEYQAAVSQRALRQRALERQQSLLVRGFSTDAAIETAKLAVAEAERAVITRDQARSAAARRLAQAEQGVMRAQIALDDAQRDLGDAEVRARFSGYVDGVDATLGRLVGVNERLGSLIDPSALEVAFKISNRDFARLLDEAGHLRRSPARVGLDLGARVVATGAEIDRVDATVDQRQGGRVVFARLTDAPGTVLRPGDFVSVTVEEPVLTDVAVLPRSAVTGRNTVFLVGEDQRLTEVAVPVLRRLGDRLVIGGPELADLVGARFVIERLPQLGPGIKVRSLTRESPAPDLVQRPSQPG
ncbi:MAG: HlyD family efflux transporter periplasmic adaptor subunit [Pseudomonadota bacterium]